MSFVGDLFAGRMRRGWLRRETSRDQLGTNGDQLRDREDRLVSVRTNGDRPRSNMPDRPVRDETSLQDRDRKPLVPETLRPDHLRFLRDHAIYVAKFYRNRLPVYLAQHVTWSPRGLHRLLVGLVRWAQDMDHWDYELASGEQAIQTGDWRSHERVAQQRKNRIKARTVPAVLGPALVLVLVFVGLTAAWWSLVLTVLGTIWGLGWFGRPMDRPYIESPVVSAPEARRITPDQIILALRAAKLCEKNGPDPEFVGAGVGRDGQGWAAVVDLPYGFTADQALGRRTEIAAGLRVDEFQVFVSKVRGNAARVALWIADVDPYSRPPVLSPLIKASSFDLWTEMPFGVNERGDPVSFRLVWTSVLIGGLPRTGKSNALRDLLAAAVLDAWARLTLFDGKGGKDFAPLEQVAHAFGAGDDDNVAKALLSTLLDFIQEMRRRYNVLRSLPDDVCPQAKLTRGLARDPKMRMPLEIIAIDEFQLYLENPRYGEKIGAALKTLAQVGPGAGIITILSTQRPSGTVMKTDLRASVGTRVGLRSADRESSEMILGSGSYRKGWDATILPETAKGVCILLGTDDGELTERGGQILRTYVLDVPEFRAICKVGRQRREGAGTLSGVAAGEQEEVLSDKILEHVLRAFRGDEKAHSDVLCQRMADDFPGLYELWDQNDLAAALSRYGIKAGNQTWAMSLEGDEKRNRKGFERQAIEDIIVRRAGEVPDSPPDDLD